MVNIVKLQQNIYLSILLFFIITGCKSLEGPIYPKYKNLGSLQDIVPESKNNIVKFYFDLYSQIYKNNLTGELIIEEKTFLEKFNNKTTKVSKLTFTLRTLSKNHNNDIRLREYKGILHYNKDNSIWDLHSQDCYTYAKKNYEDRFYVIEGWDCDHMIFFLKRDNQNILWIKDNQLLDQKLQKRNQYTKWFLAENIKINSEIIQKKWYGKYIDETFQYYIFYGKDANRFLKKGQSIKLYPYNKQLTIEEAIGDFIFIEKNDLNLNLKNTYLVL
ncbi:MAG: hypothetical protein KatS3mg129_0892 [Leptospiraceae bacterium]|nr:MAG: hypothetical protein KatS3mg129_0892 [Leptospiraceae bacterium]